jgi:hypothetical protein
MPEGKDRLETIDQWTRTRADYSSQSTILEQNGLKYGALKFSAQFQGRSMILDASR